MKHPNLNLEHHVKRFVACLFAWAATMLPADTDARLTFKEAPGAENTKVCFIEISELESIDSAGKRLRLRQCPRVVLNRRESWETVCLTGSLEENFILRTGGLVQCLADYYV